MRRIEMFVAEDNEADLYWLKMILREMGVHPVLRVAYDGEAARDFLLKRGPFGDAPDPDLVLLDINLPRLTGIEVLQEIPNAGKLPICIVTSSTMEREYVQKQFGLQGVAYLVKPVDSETLLACFRAYEHLKPIADEISEHRGSVIAS